MTYSDYRKVFKQLKVKPPKLQKYIKHNSPKQRKYGRSTKKVPKMRQAWRAHRQIWTKPLQELL